MSDTLSHIVEEIPATTAPDVKVRIKKCSKCGKKQPITEFGKNSSSGDGHKSYCRECTNALHRKRHKTDIVARLKHHIAVRVKTQFPFVEEGYVENLETHIGYPLWQLKVSLQADIQKREGISLRFAIEKGYHLDHVRPLSAFNCLELGDAEFRACWAINNLKMVSAAINLSKGARDAADYYDVNAEAKTE